MKLKTPEMFTPIWWVQMLRLHTNTDMSAEANQNGVRVRFSGTKNQDGSLVIANHSSLEIIHTGRGDPVWRQTQSAEFGVTIVPANELAGKLFCPTTGKKIPIGRIKYNPVLWCDAEYKTAMTCRGLKYESPDGAPKASEYKIEYSFLNKKSNDAFMARLRPILREAKLRCSLTDKSPMFDRNGMLKALRGIHENIDVVSVETGKLEQYVPILACDQDFRELIKNITADHYASTYLEYRP